MTADPPARPGHVYHATLSTQESIGKKNATPKTSPTTNDPRRLRPVSATASSAGPAAASGQTPAGGKAAAQGEATAQGDQEGPAQGQPAMPVSVPPAQARRGGRLGGDHPSERSRLPRIRSPGPTGPFPTGPTGPFLTGPTGPFLTGPTGPFRPGPPVPS